MSDTPKEFPPSALLTNLISGSKRKQVSPATAAVEQSFTASTSKKARLETSQSPGPYSSPSPKDFDHEDLGNGEEAGSVAAGPQPENVEDELSALTLHLVYASNFRELFVT